MIPPTAVRVQRHTSQRVHELIERRTLENVERCAAEGREAIDRRLRELDREWDMERTLQTNFALLTAASFAFGAMLGTKWHRMALVTGVFMIQHATQGWCPPVPIFRRLGFRTVQEIDRERIALKTLRGDFAEVPSDAERIVEAVER